VVRVFEWHRLLSCKCLGIVRLRFNTQKLADQVLDTWFPLASEKRGKVSYSFVLLSFCKKDEGEIHLKVVYGEGPQKVDIILTESSGEDVDNDTTAPPTSSASTSTAAIPAKLVRSLIQHS
jgi:hypothetical protein